MKTGRTKLRYTYILCSTYEYVLFFLVGGILFEIYFFIVKMLKPLHKSSAVLDKYYLRIAHRDLTFWPLSIIVQMRRGRIWQSLGFFNFYFYIEALTFEFRTFCICFDNVWVSFGYTKKIIKKNKNLYRPNSTRKRFFAKIYQYIFN